MNEAQTVTIAIHEIEPGFTMFFFNVPPKVNPSRLHCLLNTFTEWRSNHPQYRVQNLEVVKDQELVRGLNVFWSLAENAKTSHDFNFHARKEVTELYGQEYIEALMEDAAKFMVAIKQPHKICALLSRREIVIVVYKAKSEGFIFGYQEFLSSLPTPALKNLTTATFAEFKQGNAQGYHVIPLPDSYEIKLD